MVGEIRDAETARIAIEAALTGHMMLTTLHTNDAPGAIARLTEMGIETFLTASAVDCVVAQRLARKLCPHCKRRAIIPTAAAGRGRGPRRRRDRGLRAGRLRPLQPERLPGRVGIYSVMSLSERLKEMTVARAPRPRSPPSPAKRGC